MRLTGLLLGLIWASTWIFFGVAANIGDGISVVGALVHAALPGFIFLAIVMIAWRWEFIGGLALILEGLFMAIAYPVVAASRYPMTKIFWELLAMSLPAFASGVLFVLSSYRRRASSSGGGR